MSGVTKQEAGEDVQEMIWQMSQVINKNQTLSLPELYEMSDKLSEVSVSADPITKNYCETLMQKIEQIENNRNHVLVELIKISGEIDLISLRLNSLVPEEIAEKIYEFSKQLTGYAESATDRMIRKKITFISKKLDHLIFRYVFPIYEELSDRSERNNYMFQMRCLADWFKTNPKKANQCYQTISAEQRSLIEASEGNDLSEKMRSYLKTLLELSTIAEHFYYDHRNLAEKSFSKLPKSIQLCIDRVLWRYLQADRLDVIDSSTIAKAIMQYLSDLILG